MIGKVTGSVLDNYNYQKLITEKKKQCHKNKFSDLQNWRVMLPDGYYIVSDVVGSGLQ
jgi:hypothetical protein